MNVRRMGATPQDALHRALEAARAAGLNWRTRRHAQAKSNPFSQSTQPLLHAAWLIGFEGRSFSDTKPLYESVFPPKPAEETREEVPQP